MKVAILTFHWANNYGAILQAYGLRRAIEKLGHSVTFINYTPPSVRLSWWQGWRLRTSLNLPLSAFWRFRYKRFRMNYIPMTRRCSSKEELRSAAKDFDAIITGSDQVWNGNFFGFSPTYFLDFLENSKCRRISYAACFGDPLQPKGTIEKSASLLRKFDSLSVRNTLSQNLVKNIAGINAEIVVDPTLLYDFSKFTEKKISNNEYIAAYFLSHSKLYLAYELLDILKKQLQLPVILVGLDLKKHKGEKCIQSAGPIQWLQILKGASFICTNSFHGSIFSVKFRKPFIAWSSLDRRRARGPARLEDFLSTCCLQYRLISEPEPNSILELISHPIDYTAVFKKNAPYIEKSRAFLEKSLT